MYKLYINKQLVFSSDDRLKALIIGEKLNNSSWKDSLWASNNIFLK